MNDNGFEKFNFLYEALANKKAQDVVALELGDTATVADIFVLATANSETHMRTLVDAADEALSKNGYTNPRIEGGDSPNWRLIDGGDVMVHVFSRKGREYYKIEKVWGDAKIYNHVDEEFIHV